MNARKLILDGFDRLSVNWMRHMPNRLAYGYAGFMAGKVVPKLYPVGTRRARENLARLRPDLPVEETLAAMWDNVARSFLEVPRFLRFYEEGRIETVGAEILSPRPLIVCGLHLGNWELVGLALVRHGAAPVAFWQPPASEYRTRTVVAERLKGGGRLLPPQRDAARGAMQALIRDKDVFLIFPDEHQHGRVAAPSLGRGPRQGGNIEYTARLARASGAPIVFCYCERLEPRADGPTFRVTFERGPEIPRTDDREADIRAGVDALDRQMEGIILPRLPQWLMLHEFEPTG
jgi:KDO2-lipid IV(A) lauroyltransferase